jgi:hypothetical protein
MDLAANHLPNEIEKRELINSMGSGHYKRVGGLG